MRSRWVVVLALAFVAGACGSSDGSTRAFRSDVYRYTLDLPSGWTSVRATRQLDDGEPPATATGGTDVLGSKASTKVSQMPLPALVVGAQPVEADTSPDEWAAAVTRIVGSMKGCPEPDGRIVLTIDGATAVVLVYEECPAGSDLTHLWATTVHDGLGFHLVWFDHRGNLEDKEDELRVLLGGFSFE